MFTDKIISKAWKERNKDIWSDIIFSRVNEDVQCVLLFRKELNLIPVEVCFTNILTLCFRFTLETDNVLYISLIYDQENKDEPVEYMSDLLSNKAKQIHSRYGSFEYVKEGLLSVYDELKTTK